MSDNFDEKLGKALDDIEKHVKFVYVYKKHDIIIKMYVTNVEFQDNGFIIDWFCNESISDEHQNLANSDLANELKYRMEKMM